MSIFSRYCYKGFPCCGSRRVTYDIKSGVIDRSNGAIISLENQGFLTELLDLSS